MPELDTYGSGQGVLSNEHSYCDIRVVDHEPHVRHCFSGDFRYAMRSIKTLRPGWLHSTTRAQLPVAVEQLPPLSEKQETCFLNQPRTSQSRRGVEIGRTRHP